MARTIDPPTNDQLFCWEQIRRVNPLFRLSSMFAPSEHATALLALHALFAAVEETCSAALDEQVAQHKLAWWQQECLGQAPGASRHPVLRLLNASGGGALLSQPALAGLFDVAHQRLDAPPPSDEAELREFAVQVSRPLVELEAALLGAGGPAVSDELAEGLPAAGLLQLIRESMRGADSRSYWWLPLSLQARYGIGRAEAVSGDAGEPLTALFRDLIDHLGTSPERSRKSASRSRGPAPQRHLRVTVALQQRTLQRLRKAEPARYAEKVSRLSLGDVFAAWNVARRFTRPI